MISLFLADLIVLIHFLWIVFMVLGFLLTGRAFFYVYVFKSVGGAAERFFDRWIFRSGHLFGIVYVSVLAIWGKYCPLTILESGLRRKGAGQSGYTGSFIVHHIEKLVYPEVEVVYVMVPTVIIAVFVVVMFFVRPPSRFRRGGVKG